MEKSISKEIFEFTCRAKDNGIKDLDLMTKFSFMWMNPDVKENPAKIIAKGNYDFQHAGEIRKFAQKEITYLREKNIELDLILTPIYKGAVFPIINGMKPLLGPPAPSRSISFMADKVNFFFYWSSGNGPCLQLMEHIKNLLEKDHTDWNEKVHITCISIDNEFKRPRSQVLEKWWDKFDHFWAENGWESDICKSFMTRGVPFCFFVDKNGIIREAGCPLRIIYIGEKREVQFDFEKNIQILLGEKQEENQPKKEEVPIKNKIKAKEFTYEKCKIELENFWVSHNEEFKIVKSPSMKADYSKKLIDGNIEELSGIIKMHIKFDPTSKEAATKIKNDLHKCFDPLIEVEISEEELIELKFGQKCQKCGTMLEKYDQYCCIKCPENFFCTSCAEKYEDPGEDEEGNDIKMTAKHLAHPHALYFIPKDAGEFLKNIFHKCTMGDYTLEEESPAKGPLEVNKEEDKKEPQIKKSYQKEETKKDSLIINAKGKKMKKFNYSRKHFSAVCKYCLNNPKGVRWKCLFCKEFDICDDCFKTGRDPEKCNNNDSIMQYPGHCFTTHPCVRIEFDHFVKAFF